MPRVYDRHPGQRGAGSSSLYNPTRSGLAYQDPMSAIDGTAAAAGDLVRGNLALIIKELTGIDLTGAFEFVDWLGGQIGLVLHGFGQLWQQLLDGIVNAWLNVTASVGATVDNVLDTLAEAFGITQGNVLSTSNAAITAQATIATSAGGGYDEFDYPSAATLPSSAYDIIVNGGGGGSYGPNGLGHLVWKVSGLSWREVVYRRNDIVLGQDNGVVTSVWQTKIKNPLFADSYGYLCCRMANDSSETYMRASIDNNQARIEAVVDGDVIQIGPTINLSWNPGDVFKLFYGTTLYPRRFWLRQNSVTVLTVDDDDEVSALGAGHRSVGIGCYVGQYVLTQNPAPSLAGWTWAPQTTP